MPGIFEQLIERLDRLEHELDQLWVGTIHPNEIWAEGVIRVSDAPAFCGLGRTELYSLMAAGELPWSKPGRHRLIPRRWLVRYLAKRTFHAHAEAR